MLIVDGIRYELSTPQKEEELETFVEEHYKRIFGDDSLYFSIKKRLRSLGGIGSIPDGYALTLSKPYRWFIVEVELSSHPIFDHVVTQLNKFVQGIKAPNSKKSIVEALYSTIKENVTIEAYIKDKLGSGEIYRFLSSTVDNPPCLAVIIDEKTKELEEACESIPISRKYIIEFKVFERVDAKIKNAFLIEPVIWKTSPQETNSSSTPSKRPRITNQPEYAIPLLQSLIDLGGRGRVQDVYEKIFEKMKDKFIPADLEILPSGITKRWKNQAQWMRFKLKKQGFLKADSPSGIWEITEKGRARVRQSSI